MKKILVVTDDKQMGGVSILLEDILKNISSKIKIDLMILNNSGNCLENLNDNINIIYGTKFFDIIGIHLKTLLKDKNIIGILKKIYLIFLMKTGLIKYKIKKERKKMNIENYDLEIAFKDSFCTTFTAYGDSLEKIQWIHSDYSKINYLKNYHNLYLRMFKLFNKFVAVSNPVKKSFNEIYGNEEKTIVINNYIDTNKIIEKSKLENIKLSNKKINLISVGRLHKDKGYDCLIKIIYKLKEENNFKDCHLTLVGGGDEFDNLNNLVNDLNLTEEISLIGNKDNPYIYLKKADLFILSSKHESFGNVVIEALVLNVPVISTEVANIKNMLDKEYGVIVKNNEDSLYEGLKEILMNKELIKEYKNNLKNYNYPNKKIISEIEKLLNN